MRETTSKFEAYALFKTQADRKFSTLNQGFDQQEFEKKRKISCAMRKP